MDAILGERIARHGLAGRPCATVAAAAARTCAIQAQDHPAARLGVRARAAALTDADVVRAVAEERSVVRTWLMRGTIHLVDAADVRWLVGVFGPALRRRFATRWRQLGLTEQYLEHTLRALPAVLAGGPLTKTEIIAGLAEADLPFDFDDPQAGLHILLHASAHGLLCRAGDRGRRPSFTLLDDWLPDTHAVPLGDDALAELGRRYFAAYSPATAADFAVWSGLGATRVIELIRDELTECDVYGKPGFRLGEVEPERGLRLLPAFDNYLLGYKARAFVPAERIGEVYVGGLIRATVVLDGRVIGRWQLTRGKNGVAVEVHPFSAFDRAQTAAVRKEVEDIGRFLDVPAELVLQDR